MSLGMFRDVKEIHGCAIHQDDKIADGKWSDVDEKFCICIHHGDNTISFRLKDEKGEGGCDPSVISKVGQMLNSDPII